MGTFVLIHGAWHGGWCWKKVTPLLRAAGHEVYTPTLTGLGERTHLGHAGVNLDTHIQDVVNVLEYEDLADVVLVGHSYGGIVISGVAERAADRLAHLVYLDAMVRSDGQSAFGDNREAEERWRRQTAETGEGWRMPPPAMSVIGLADETDIQWELPRLVDQPLQTWTQPVRIANPAAAALPRTYIWANQFAGTAHEAARVRDDPAWRYREVDSSHMVMVTAPEALVALLIEALETTAAMA